MAGEIRQPRNVTEVQPSNRARDAGRRKRPRQAEEHNDGDAGKQRPRRDDGHRVDEYV
jgi:hypothetical protein